MSHRREIAKSNHQSLKIPKSNISFQKARERPRLPHPIPKPLRLPSPSFSKSKKSPKSRKLIPPPPIQNRNVLNLLYLHLVLERLI